MKIKCLKRYKNGALGVSYKPGQEVEVSDQMYHYLKQDAPGCFEDVATKAPSEPAKNKAVRKPRAKKAVK